MSERVLGVAEITHRNGVVETLEYLAHGASPIGWTFQVEGDGLVIIHPASVQSIKITRYKLDLTTKPLVV